MNKIRIVCIYATLNAKVSSQFHTENIKVQKEDKEIYSRQT